MCTSTVAVPVGGMLLATVLQLALLPAAAVLSGSGAREHSPPLPLVPAVAAAAGTTASAGTSAGASGAAPAAAAAVLQISGRGMACAAWHGGAGPPPGIGQDCVNHHAADSPQPQGGPWWGTVDPSTGECAAIPGVTEFFGNCMEVHGNLAPTSPGQALGYAGINETSGAYAVAVTLPLDKGGQPGSVRQLDKVAGSGWPPAWSEPDGDGGVVGWTYVELHGTGAAAVGVSELLQVLRASDGSVVKTLGNASTELGSRTTLHGRVSWHRVSEYELACSVCAPRSIQPTCSARLLRFV